MTAATAFRTPRLPAIALIGEHGDEERGETRLRVGEVETGPEQRDQDDRRQRRDAAEPHGDDDHDDSEYDVPSVEARIAEERRDPEDRRVGVRHLQVRGEEEQLARERLPDSDHGEQRGQRDRDDREHARHPGREGSAGDDDDESGEREQEERQRRRPGLEIARPEERQGSKGREGCRRHRGEQRQGGDVVVTHDADDQRQAGGPQHAVERQQPPELAAVSDPEEEARVGVDVERQPEGCRREHEWGGRGRPAHKGGDPERDQDEACGAGGELERPNREVRASVTERPDQPRFGAGQECESCEEHGPCPRRQHERGAECTEHGRKLSGVSMIHRKGAVRGGA